MASQVERPLADCQSTGEEAVGGFTGETYTWATLEGPPVSWGTKGWMGGGGETGEGLRYRGLGPGVDTVQWCSQIPCCHLHKWVFGSFRLWKLVRLFESGSRPKLSDRCLSRA